MPAGGELGQTEALVGGWGGLVDSYRHDVRSGRWADAEDTRQAKCVSANLEIAQTPQ